jgi:putative flippase GtrA
VNGVPAPRSTRGQLAVFAVIGAASTVVHLSGFVLLRQVVDSAQVVNGAALVVAAMTNTWANRRWTFGVRGRERAALHQAQGLAVLGLTLAMTSGGLWLLGVVAPSAGTRVQTGVVAVTTALATGVKFLSMRWLVLAPHARRHPASQVTPPSAAAQNSATTNVPAESAKSTAPVHS